MKLCVENYYKIIYYLEKRNYSERGMNMEKEIEVTGTYLEQVEQQIYTEQTTVAYDTREFTIEIIVKKYLDNLESDENEIYVPEYQREFVWSQERQSKFIESLILGLPIPLIFVAENKDGRMELVDGSQRVRTLAAFINNDLQLKGLAKLDKLNNLYYEKLSTARKRKFNNLALRIIVLSEKTTELTKNDMFERINRGSDLLKDMEKRKGIYKGKFADFIYECARDKRYQSLTPLSKWLINRQEYEELLLRFFALSEMYPRYRDGIGIAKILDDYIDEKNGTFKEEEQQIKLTNFHDMLNFVEANFDSGFAKNKSIQQVSRVYFEAISVGVLLALREKPNLNVEKSAIKKMISSEQLLRNVSGKYHTHKPYKIKERVEYVRDYLLRSSK